MNNRLNSLLIIFCLCACTITAWASKIPSMYITTSDSSAITSRDYWKTDTHIRIVMPDGKTSYETGTAQIKARGNSTFSKPKKPFALRLAKAHGLIGMKANKDWILLANFMDHSKMRNSLALEISKQTSMDWTADSRFVDVYVNGKLQGCYLLCESIHEGKEANELRKGKGVLIESDSYPSKKGHFKTTMRHLPVNVRIPSKPTEGEMKEIEKLYNDIEAILYGNNNDLSILYEKYIDLGSFVDWWIIQELTQNAEPNGPRSCYMHKSKNGKLKAGPIWDYDLAFISVGLDKGGDIRPSRLTHLEVRKLNGDCLYNDHALWYERLLKDEPFRQIVKRRWSTLRPKFMKLLDTLDKWYKEIEESALADDKLWLGEDPAKFDIYPGFKESASNLKKVYLYRIKSLDKLFDEL